MPSAATTANKSHPPDDLSTGSFVFHPLHGVAEVVGIEQRTVGDERPSFYVLELAAGGKLLLPTDNVKLSDLRTLIPAAHARRLLKLVTQAPEADEEPWRERSAHYADTLKQGDADGNPEVLRQLLFRSATTNLNMTERRQLDTARSYFVAEISLVLDRSAQELEDQLLAIAEGDATGAG